MTEQWIVPSDGQQELCLLAQAQIVETVNQLIAEGIDARIVMAGLGAATADTLTMIFGPTSIAPWFEKQAELVRDLQRGSN